ncbi:MAG: pyruvate formate-lyase-activating protein [Clostridia bacterium]
MKAKIHSFESMATLDGDGVRYAVFLAGCPLRCQYCHNPDTWGGGFEMDAEALLKKIERYKPYFQNGGGVTFSGGEPLLQAEFICEIAEKFNQVGIKYALDTSGHVNLTENVKKAVEMAELVILDLKFWDKESYQKYTNGDFEKVIAFAKFLQLTNKRVWMRTVVVPNINDSAEILDKYTAIVKRFSCVEKYELLAFHTMGFFKYDKLGIENLLKNTKALDADKLAQLQQYVNSKLIQNG